MSNEYVRICFTKYVSKSTQYAKDCGPHNRACQYGRMRSCGSKFLAHAVLLICLKAVFEIPHVPGIVTHIRVRARICTGHNLWHTV